MVCLLFSGDPFGTELISINETWGVTLLMVFDLGLTFPNRSGAFNVKST